MNLVEMPVGDVALEGKLVAPENSTGVVIFAHGSGSSRKSPRNIFVAEKLTLEAPGRDPAATHYMLE